MRMGLIFTFDEVKSPSSTTAYTPFTRLMRSSGSSSSRSSTLSSVMALMFSGITKSFIGILTFVSMSDKS